MSLYLDIAADMRFFISEAQIMSLPAGEDRVLRQRQLRQVAVHLVYFDLGFNCLG